MKNRIKAKAVTQLSGQFSGLKVATENKTIKGRRRRWRERERKRRREGEREKKKGGRDCDETERQESGGQRGMQFASRRSFCRRVTAFTDFERTIPPRLLWFPSSAFPLIATTRAIILTGSPDRIARHRASVGPRRPMTREKQPRRCYQFPPLLLTRSRECGERKTHPPIFTIRGIETTLFLLIN